MGEGRHSLDRAWEREGRAPRMHLVTRLGAVLAGGQSSRFGTDKALAVLHGETLLDRARTLLAPQCDAVVVVGREDGVPDWPRPHMGPLGGIAGALRHAAAHGFAEVLTIAVDAVNLPADLAARLAPAPACLAAQPVIGLWPVTALPAVEAILAGAGRHSMRALADAVAARAVHLAAEPANINTPADLAALARMEMPDGL